MPIGEVARSVLCDYLEVRESVMPHTNALWVSEQGEHLGTQRSISDPEALGCSSGYKRDACPPVPPLLRCQRPEGRDAGAGAKNNWRVGKNT